ncbi:uncharacterized protein LOC125223963 [Salvia hispanica]|uniref:uncharacterized protein LOC125223963 n=1 Tax=Salvia hispanica TaxID=49212 RepID=UPI002008F755|nr:uncharacterized protein LOC125223963 [Salvia hispanica]
MQFRTLQITQLSGKNLPSEKMPIYAAVSISGGTEQYTKPSGSANPAWNFQMEFKVGETALWKNSLTLEFRLLCNAADDEEVVVGSLDVSVRQLFESRKSPHVGSVSGEHGDDAGELTFSYKFIGESAPSASGSGQPGWKAAAADRAGAAIKAAADVAGVGMKVAADVGGVGMKVAADVAGVGMKAAADVGEVGMKTVADVANKVGWAIVKFVKNEKVESGKKDECGANKRNEKEKEKEMREKMNVIRNLPAQQAPASSKAGPSSTNNGKTQGGPSTQNTGLRTGEGTGTGTHNPFKTGEATGTYNPFQTLATKFMSTDLRPAGQGDRKG